MITTGRFDGAVGFTPCPGEEPPTDHPQVVEPRSEGYDPDAGNVASIDIGVFKQVVITPYQPLGDRKIADGGLTR